MIEGQGLRFVRTTLLGHMPGWSPSVDIVGPWRPVSLIEPGGLRVGALSLTADWSRDEGAVLHAALAIEGAGGEAPVLSCAGASAPMARAADGRFEARLAVRGARPWFPHTHGEQPLYAVTVATEAGGVDLGRTGFRRIELDRGADGRGFGLAINGVRVFARGAAWVAPDLVRMGGARADYAPTLALAREAGMNMVRIAGVGAYETRAFYDLAAELGILVWQDFMFANFDYPVADPAFAEAARREAEALLAELQGAPALAVLCGGSEVMQQAAMMGLPKIDWPLFDQILPEAAGRLRPDAPYVPNTPWDGPQPFAASEGVTHYYGVGAYERPLEDARRAEVRFAAECLAFANAPQPETLEAHLKAPAVHDPRWKARVPRDRAASWDFEDTRDHYLQRLYGVEPNRLRREDPALYLDLSRSVSAEVMAAVFAEWRRPASPCAGGLVWTLRDLDVGAGWGVIDATGEPKPAWYGLKRVLQPLFLGLTDEGVNGLVVHLVNEGPRPFEGELRLAAFAEAGRPLVDARRAISLAAGGAQSLSGFELLGRFFDLNYSYRFGPRPHAAVLAELVGEDGRRARAVHLLDPRAGLSGGGVEAALEPAAGGWRVTLTSDRLQRYVHIGDRLFRPADDGFVLLPGEAYGVDLIPRAGTPPEARPQGELLAPGGAVVGGYGG
jgi:beta-mannosidase